MDTENVSKRTEMLVELKQKLEKLNSKLNASGSSALSPHDLRNLSEEVQQLLSTTSKAEDPCNPALWIHDELDKVFKAEKVGHSCDLCQYDLALDPERPPGASLVQLQEVCVLSCGHVYHFKCLKGITLDLDNRSADPSCIFCISSSG